jgi:hypothetical protein
MLSIGLYGLNKRTGSCDGFLVIPEEALGREYYMVSFYTSSSSSAITTALGVVVPEDDSVIQFDFYNDVEVFICLCIWIKLEFYFSILKYFLIIYRHWPGGSVVSVSTSRPVGCGFET